MPFVMSKLNVISRCASLYISEKLGDELGGCYHPFVLLITRSPGLSQDEISYRLCFNKSTVARAVSYLEDNGFAKRETDAHDKRVYRVYPTDKMLKICPKVREISSEWNRSVSHDISEEDMAIFNSVLNRIAENARELVLGGDKN